MAPVEVIVTASAAASLTAATVSALKESDHGFNMLLSDAIGYVSLVCWVVVMFPQIYLNYQRKSGEGVSLTMMVAWVIGDILNITGALMQSMVMSTILIGTYYLFVDLTLLAQTIYYRLAYNAHSLVSKDSSLGNTTSSSHVARDDEDEHGFRQTQRSDSSNDRILHQPSADYASIASAAASDDNTGNPSCDRQGLPNPAPLSELAAQAMGVASAVVYIMAYVPQVLQNYRRKSCEGLSMWLFLLSLVGNTTYTLAIMVVSLQPHYLAPYVPWILGSLIPCLIQAIVLYQFYIYA
ncbi:PQ-loop-domain-containing protein [Coemansia reversa NRRL 1564]|uniref:PQ-loop-domain-containing protein n=1 Tax=Coemansia reversa (strain ATCC 12441 / NRRL 1564) TaxID=763665 RepID=A0A2G5B4Y9_COERN|nr:PQ-loop-domain-containing protein [Coemansia reversa NRRL 1564]|eukprot:PIA14113.1 PQ-loop-domain-containing protein [Coemansia reversa NRRL 1564]